MPTAAMAKMERSAASAGQETLIGEQIFGKLRKLTPVWLHHRSLLANRNLAEGS
jgi:hypothetical protein